MIFGYLANEKWLLNQASSPGLVVGPDIADFENEEEYKQERERALKEQKMTAMIYVVRRVGARVGINNLRLATVWVSQDASMLFWRLPASMGLNRTAEDTRKLENLHNIISSGGTFEEPKQYVSGDSDAPRALHNVTEVPPEIQAMRF